MFNEINNLLGESDGRREERYADFVKKSRRDDMSVEKILAVNKIP
jgi:hypothetical protein